jgi:hypothetical protein
VLAKETPDHGSRLVLDLDVPDMSRDEDLSELVDYLEDASEGKSARALPARFGAGSGRRRFERHRAGGCMRAIAVFPVEDPPDWQVVTDDAV